MVYNPSDKWINPAYSTYRGKFRSQISYLWTDAATVARAVREENGSEDKESAERGLRCAKRWKSRETLCFSPVSGGSKSRLAKAAGAEPSGRMRDQNEAHFENKMHKTPQVHSTLDVEMSKSARRCGTSTC